MAVARFPVLELSSWTVTNHSLPVCTGLDAPGGRHSCTDLHSLWGTQQQESSHVPVPSPLPFVPMGMQDCQLCLLGHLGIWGSVHWIHALGDHLSQREWDTARTHLVPSRTSPPNRLASLKCPRGLVALQPFTNIGPQIYSKLRKIKSNLLFYI